MANALNVKFLALSFALRDMEQVESPEMAGAV